MFFVFRVKMEDIGLERFCEFYSGKGSGWKENMGKREKMIWRDSF